MAQTVGNEETYKKVKKRIAEYKIRNFFAKLGSFIFAVLTLFSLLPLVPTFIVSFLSISSIFIIPLWAVCFVAFVWLFSIFQKYSNKIEDEFGVTLEESMFVSAYESLCFLKEYLDPEHPILGSKKKAIRRLKDIAFLLSSAELPNLTIIDEEATQLEQLETNLGDRLVPSIKKILSNNPDSTRLVSSVLPMLVDYFSKPKLDALILLNSSLSSLPESEEKGISHHITDVVLKRSNARHVLIFSGVTVASFLASYVDFYYLMASASDAFTLGIGTCIGLVAVYVAYLGLTRHK